jgi:hypothetical protein
MRARDRGVAVSLPGPGGALHLTEALGSFPIALLHRA